MAFNFGGFVSGMGQQIVKDIEAEEEQQRRKEMIAEDEASKMRLRRAEDRRQANKKLESQTQALTFLGYNKSAIARILAQGEMAVETALSAGQRALETGVDINTILASSGVPDNVKDGEKEINATIDAATPELPTLGGGLFDAQGFSTLMSDVDTDEKATSYGSRLARIDQLLSRPSTKNKETLQAEKKQLLAGLKQYQDAQREDTGNDDEFSDPFSMGTLSSAVRTNYARYLADYDMGLDAEGRITGKFEGNQMKVATAKMNTANYLESTYADVSPAMKKQADQLRSEATFTVQREALAKVSNGAFTEVATRDELKMQRPKIGEVIKITENGVTKYIVYTGVYNMPFMQVNNRKKDGNN